MKVTRVGHWVLRGKSAGRLLCLLSGLCVLPGCTREIQIDDADLGNIPQPSMTVDLHMMDDGALLWVGLREKAQGSEVWSQKNPCPVMLQEKVSEVVKRFGNCFPVRFAVDPSLKVGEFWPLVKAVVEARVINTSFRLKSEAEGAGVVVYVMHDEQEWANISKQTWTDPHVSIDGQQLMLNGANITRAAYAAVLEEIAREGDPREANFYIFATPDTEYRTLDDLLKATSRSGVRRIAFSALPEKSR